MTRFLAGVWFGNNEHSFDVIEAAACLDRKEINIIIDWLSDPFWP